MQIKPQVRNEFGTLTHVVLGSADGFGNPPLLKEAYDPKSKEHIRKGTYPLKKNVQRELTSFENVLKKYGVTVYRPETLVDENQIFTRDIGFVIEDKFFVANMLKERGREFPALVPVLERIGVTANSRIVADDDVRFEGGDVMPLGDVVFIGYEKEPDFSEYTVSRTNVAGVNFIKKHFPEKEIFAFELLKSDDDPRANALHLDCCFQPLGLGHCLIYKGGFKNENEYDFIKEYIGKDNCIDISQEEMYEMGTNVFSIRENVVVSHSGQKRINNELRLRGYTVEEVDYHEISKMGGLFRCSTMPLRRK